MTHKGTVTLETKRLILRRFTADDAEVMFRNWASDPEVSKYLTWPTHTSVDVSRSVISSWIDLYPNDNHYSWAIVLKELGEAIGSIGVVKQDPRTDTVEIGYCIGKTWWGKGYMPEALCCLVRFFFEEVDAKRVEARHDARNQSSGRVMLKAGLRYEGTLRGAGRNNQGICDDAYYAILAEDYFGRTINEVAVIPYDPKYRDDMLFCFLAAKDAISSYAPPEWSRLTLKEDLLDVNKNYLERGEVFYLAVDEHGRVVGMVGTQTDSRGDLWLKRLFIKPVYKGKGIGSKLLAAVERYAAKKGVTSIHTRFANWYREAATFYPAKGFVEAEPDRYLRHMVLQINNVR